MAARWTTCIGVECGTTAEILSAELDGEATEEESSRAQAHLDSCADCREWYRDVAAVTRSVRVMPAEPAPDVTEAVLPAWQPSRRDRLRGPAGRHLRTTLRSLLGMVAVVQLAVALTQLTGFALIMGSAQAHVTHETGSWNAAIAVALGWVALRSRHARAHVPVLVSFTAVLGGLSVLDIAAGEVGLTRVATHAPILIGVGLVMGLAWLQDPEPAPKNPVAQRYDWMRFRRSSAHEPATAGPPSGVTSSTRHPGERVRALGSDEKVGVNVTDRAAS